MHPNYGPPPQVAAMPWYPAPTPPAPGGGRAGRGLAIASLVLSALAVLGVLAVAVWVLLRPSPNDTGTGSGNGPLTGQLSASTGGGPLTGAALSRDVTVRIDQDGGAVSLMNCPATPKVGQGVVTICHGVISSAEYAIVVYFEDQDGHYTLSPL